MIEFIILLCTVILGLSFAIFEGILYYNPFKENKFWSREYFSRVKKNMLEKYFPIDGGHLVKYFIILMISSAYTINIAQSLLEFIIRTLIYFTTISIPFNFLLGILKNKAKKNER